MAPKKKSLRVGTLRLFNVPSSPGFNVVTTIAYRSPLRNLITGLQTETMSLTIITAPQSRYLEGDEDANKGEEREANKVPAVGDETRLSSESTM